MYRRPDRSSRCLKRLAGTPAERVVEYREHEPVVAKGKFEPVGRAGAVALRGRRGAGTEDRADRSGARASRSSETQRAGVIRGHKRWFESALPGGAGTETGGLGGPLRV